MRKFVLPLAAIALAAGCNAAGDDPTSTDGPAPPPTVAADAAPADEPPEVLIASLAAQNESGARDPGPRAGIAGAGAPLAGIAGNELTAFGLGQTDFAEAEEVDEGLGPTMNLDSCGGCHSQPAVGGSSPAVNPQVAFAALNGAANRVPSFLHANGPVREARFVRNADGSADGGVHALFTIAGRADTPANCQLQQPDFARELARHNVVFRIPTPVFGAGLIEQIPDGEILANQARAGAAKRALGIGGRANMLPGSNAVTGQVNKNGNDGTIGRFGWKAQNKSLLIFSGEAYNVEMGITNDLFPTERDETQACNVAATPNSGIALDAPSVAQGLASIDKFSVFMRFLAAPLPSANAPGGAPSIAAGKALFDSTGCALCHTPTLHTGNTSVAALRSQDVNLFSDLLLHDMGRGLADGVSQGQAGGREFRSAPLWGLGQRLFFLHDGRTADLRLAILAHASSGSEANAVVRQFTRLAQREQQDLLNFLRSL